MHLTSGFVGFDNPHAGNTYVVCPVEAHGTGHETHRGPAPATLASGELGPSFSPISEGLGQVQAGVVVGTGSVLIPPRGQLVTVLVPELL